MEEEGEEEGKTNDSFLIHLGLRAAVFKGKAALFPPSAARTRRAPCAWGVGAGRDKTKPRRKRRAKGANQLPLSHLFNFYQSPLSAQLTLRRRTVSGLLQSPFFFSLFFFFYFSSFSPATPSPIPT